MEVLERNEKQYTYSDYYSWEDGQRWELIDGYAYLMAPGPSQAHQEAISNLLYQLATFLKGKPCKVIPAPFDVRLNASSDDNTVVQPDLLVVCDKSKLDGKSCVGAPDLVIEILSPSTARFDRTVKFDQYKKAGVREYWIVDPDTKTVSAHILQNGEYMIRAYSDTGTAPVSVLEGCEINLAEIFEEDEPTEA